MRIRRMLALVATIVLLACGCPMMTNAFTLTRSTTKLPATTSFRRPFQIGLQEKQRCTCRKPLLIRGTTVKDTSGENDSHPPTRLAHSDPHPSRRSFFKSTTLGIAITVTAVLTPPPEPAQARGLVEFPCNKKPLQNKYYFMRAGTTLMEEQDIWSTNPLFLTNREAALSQTGIAQVQEASRFLVQNNINPSVVKYSLAAAAMDTAQILKDSELQVGQNRLIPEFTFMDPRAIGKWDMMSLSQTQPAVFAMDVSQAGVDGTDGRPPPNEDGTPHETLADQAIRLRQLMSVLETQFSGDTILLVFPDGTSPALLSAMMGGIPYNRVHELEFQPGEVRLDVTYPSVRAYLQQQEQDAATMKRYQTTLKQGQVEWDRLQSIKIDDLISKKDQNIEKERLEIELQYQQDQDERQAQQEAERQAREDILAQREAERQLKRQQQQQQGDDGMSSMPLGVMGGVAAAGIIGLSVTVGGKNVEEELQVAPALVATTNNNNSTIGLDPSLSNDNWEGSSATPGTLPMSSSSSSSSSSPSLFDNPQPPRPLSEEDRQAAAEQAMEAYMDQDDGGDAWLQVMSDLAQQSEEDEDETDSFLLENGETDIRIDQDGIITAKKSNGSTDPIGNPVTRTPDDDNEKDTTF